MANFFLLPQSSSHLHGHQSLIFKWYANGRVIGISRYALAGSFHVYEEVTCTLLSCIQALFTKKGHVIRRNLKIPNARVSRFVDWCTVMTLESFSSVFCQSKEFDRVTDWLKYSLQAIVVYVKYLFMFQNDYKRLDHSVICSIDYWLLYVNRKFKWYDLERLVAMQMGRVLRPN
jgi:hypothetical protein